MPSGPCTGATPRGPTATSAWARASVGFLKWAFAEGQQGGALGFETYYLLLNVNTQPVDVEATFLREDGMGLVRTLQIPPRARLDLRATDPEIDDQRFALFLRSLSTRKFYAERSVYWGPGWDGGHNAKGREWKWAIGTPLAPPAVDPPIISPPPGTFANGVSATIDATPGASVRYTTDGTEPTQDSPLYGGPFLLDGLPTVKARAYAAGFAPSEVTTNSPYTFQVAGPVFDRTSGVYTAEVSVGVLSATLGAAFHCGIDGAPLTPCVSPITLTTSGSLRVQATKAGYTESSVTESTYTIEAAGPVATPGGHTFENTVAVAWASTPGAAIHYTTDGSEPTPSAPLYTGPVTLSATTTIRARAWKTGCEPSPITTEVYTRAAVAAPVFTPSPPGPYVGAALVEMTTPTEGATIHYTLDGSDPTAASPTYQAPVTLAAPALSFNPTPPPQTVRAAAFNESGESIISTATYSLTGLQCGYIWGVIAICEWWGEIGCAYWEWEFVPIGLYCRDARPPIDGSITIDDVNFETGVVTVTGVDPPVTGDLKIWLLGQGDPSHLLATDPAMGNGTHGYPFQVAAIPPGYYNRAYATWTALDARCLPSARSTTPGA